MGLGSSGKKRTLEGTGQRGVKAGAQAIFVLRLAR